MTPATAKQLALHALDELPDDASLEDAMDRLYFVAKVARGLAAADRGETLSHEEVRREFLGAPDE